MSNRWWRKFILASLAAALPFAALAQTQESASSLDAEHRIELEGKRPNAGVTGHVFAFPVASRSTEAQKLVELAIDEYENVLLDRSVANAQKAVEKDPQFALGYAVWSFAARRNKPNLEAAQKAESLAANAPADERLLVKFLTSVQKDDMLPAIATMNDLLARFPEDRHVLYLTAEWLYFEQDYDRSIRMMEQIVKLDPSFAPAWNMLGYSQVESGAPDPVKAISYLKKYAALQPGNPNPEDSLGEVSRFVGDDQGSLIHYRSALEIVPNFVTSQIGLGDTYTLMGDYKSAAREYDKAIAIANNEQDRMHARFQKALMSFWQGHRDEGMRALIAADQDARRLRTPYAQFEIEEAAALLTAKPDEQLQKLKQVEEAFRQKVEGMSDADRNTSLAAIWRDQARILAQQKQFGPAQTVVLQLEKLAGTTRDLIVENCYESARGYLFFAQQDFANAADELSADPHSPLAFLWLAAAREKNGDFKGEEAAKLRLKYLRAPTAEWYLASHTGSPISN